MDSAATGALASKASVSESVPISVDQCLTGRRRSRSFSLRRSPFSLLRAWQCPEQRHGADRRAVRQGQGRQPPTGGNLVARLTYAPGLSAVRGTVPYQQRDLSTPCYPPVAGQQTGRKGGARVPSCAPSQAASARGRCPRSTTQS